jgi:uncharacterized protein (DUF1697 family)
LNTQYVALLRGINVGGSNIIRMSDLRVCFEEMGLEDILTYIQSGNVVFRSNGRDIGQLTRTIEKGLSEKFRYSSRVVVLSRIQLGNLVKDAPRGFGTDPGRYRYDVIFLREPLTANTALEQIVLTRGVDRAYPGKGVFYFSRLAARASQSRLSRVTSLAIYQYMTVRNWNTTTKLLSLMD